MAYLYHTTLAYTIIHALRWAVMLLRWRLACPSMCPLALSVLTFELLRFYVCKVVGRSCRLSILYSPKNLLTNEFRLPFNRLWFLIRSVMNAEATLHERVYLTANPNENWRHNNQTRCFLWPFWHVKCTNERYPSKCIATSLCIQIKWASRMNALLHDGSPMTAQLNQMATKIQKISNHYSGHAWSDDTISKKKHL
jgi:hypothetical protein